MNVTAPTPPQAVHDFVKTEGKFFYASIPNTHNQLRHLASSPVPDVVYFVKRNQVYKLNVSTKERIFVVCLPFEARCMATGHGYFCAGDDKGNLAYMRIPEGSTSEDGPADGSRWTGGVQPQRNPSLSNFYQPLEPLEPTTEWQSNESLGMARVGDQIVNSISIHKVENANYLTTNFVAVITNNNHKVLQFSFTRLCTEFVYAFDCAPNHASISPDGTLLAVVGDNQYMHLFKREDFELESDALDTDKLEELEVNGWFTWTPWKRLELPCGPHLDSLAFFSTCWNSAGNLLATASEGGYISLIDVTKLETAEDNGDCVIAFVPAKRPGTAYGAVRSMCFAPYPYEFLLWAENNGAICVAELRSNLIKRQEVKLDDKAPSMKMEQVVDLPRMSRARAAAFDDARGWEINPTSRYSTQHRENDDPSESLRRIHERLNQHTLDPQPRLGELNEEQLREQVQPGLGLPLRGPVFLSPVGERENMPIDPRLVNQSSGQNAGNTTRLDDVAHRNIDPNNRMSSELLHIARVRGELARMRADFSSGAHRYSSTIPMNQAALRRRGSSILPQPTVSMNDQDVRLVEELLNQGPIQTDPPSQQDVRSLLRARSDANNHSSRRINVNIPSTTATADESRGDEGSLREPPTAMWTSRLVPTVAAPVPLDVPEDQHDRLRRLLATYDARDRSRALNWVGPTEELRRLVSTTGRWNGLPLRTAMDWTSILGGGMTEGEAGPGTQGVMCSADGTSVYVATEGGIFALELSYESRKWAAAEEFV